MAYCAPCQRSFPIYNGYQQHLDNSAMHQNYVSYDWECQMCNLAYSSQEALHQHQSDGHHPYCIPCKKMFVNNHNLMQVSSSTLAPKIMNTITYAINQHQHSRTHVGSGMPCPFCKQTYATASGVTIHLESGTCSSGMNRQKINAAIQSLDRNHIITNRQITMPGYENSNTKTIATERAWNGYAYECYLCHREFNQLNGLNQHLSSPAHEQKIYRCPKGGCGREFKLLSGLVAHFESESCGLFRFSDVQKQAQSGIHNMVGRMLQWESFLVVGESATQHIIWCG